MSGRPAYTRLGPPPTPPLGVGPGQRRDAQQAQPESFGTEEFHRRVADRIGGRPRTAQWDACAVLTSVADSAGGGELDRVISRLPSSHAVLFGKPDLADGPRHPHSPGRAD